MGSSRSCPEPEVEPRGGALQSGHLAEVLPRPPFLVEEGGGWKPGPWATGFSALVGGWVGGRAQYWLSDQTSPPLRGRREGLEPGGRK